MSPTPAPNFEPLQLALDDVALALESRARDANLIDVPGLPHAIATVIDAGRTLIAHHRPNPQPDLAPHLATLRDWEQARRQPDAPARALLRIVERNPKAALEALAE